MAAKAIEIAAPTPDGGERLVRVTNPDREIYPPTDRTPSVTKKMVAEYVVAVGEPLMRILGNRPTALERWPGGVHPGMHLALGPGDKDADGFYQKRLMKGAPDYARTASITFPSGRTAAELCPSEIAVAVWCAQMGTIAFHPWAVRKTDDPASLDQPDELRIDLDPQPGTTFADVVRVAGVTRELLADLGMTGYCKTSGNRGVHVYVRIEPRWDFVDVRHAAIALGRELEKRDSGTTTAWWKEERGERIFVDYNQNCRDRSIAAAWSLRAVQGATVSTPLTWSELADVDDPHEFNLFTVPDKVASDGDPWSDMDSTFHSIQPLLDLWDANPVELNYPPDYPKMPGEPPRVQPSKKVAANWEDDGSRV
ncbi:ATP-dependent DNA ligase [Rhodococcoides trifolii]|uniref:ATP-dependent DNA ligase n=1 Tax=Rhodococcoides trifolii TaxID=908250 RepID=A0A917CLV3_9NOCA|nr:DNA polymerase domain-containing protein [Rhodococcus trifolii]GGF92959.1 ATP-dependent DNA ligase [Rhodococcus trifolii]